MPSPITARFGELSPGARDTLSHSGESMARLLLSAVPQSLKDAAAGESGASMHRISNSAIKDMFTRSIAEVRYLFAEIAPSIHAPDLRALEESGMDFVKLAGAYERYEQNRLDPELVLGPVNVNLESWRKMYSNLRAWQDVNDPQSSWKLRKQVGGDGLWTLEYIERHYDAIIAADLASLSGTCVTVENGEASSVSRNGNHTAESVWKLAVIPTADRSGESSVVYLAEKNDGGYIHTPIGLYLTIQAARIFRRKKPLDLEGCTRLGTVMRAAGDGDAFIPQGNFGPINGQVYLFGYETQNQDQGGAWGNARLPVWG